MRVARQSRFHRILDSRPVAPGEKFVQGTAEPALPGHSHSPLGG